MTGILRTTEDVSVGDGVVGNRKHGWARGAAGEVEGYLKYFSQNRKYIILFYIISAEQFRFAFDQFKNE